MSNTLDCAVLAAWLQSEDTQSLWYNNLLLLVVWWWNTLKSLESVHGGGTPGGLVWDHASDGSLEDF